LKADTARLLKKATRAIHAAELLLDCGDADFAIGRAYYAMFYAATALLEEHGFRVRKHSAVHALFGNTSPRQGVSTPNFTVGSWTPLTAASKPTTASRRTQPLKRLLS
jgi:uncharacterized protein (UPF0332 family)